ncbi:MAG: repeat-containing protein, partial [Bryobacterales bacterium]|nr:repeat-containing protein [Bryobacterales bacterium]
LLLGVAVAFGGSLRGTFHFDDYSLLSNPLVTQSSGLWRIWNPIQTRPLTYLTFWLNYRLGGTNPIGYHAVNLLLHAAVVVLLFHVLRKSIDENAALIAAGIFAVHPIQSEAVAYIFARGTLLCTLLCLASLNDWLRGRRWTAVVWFAAALLAKEECVTFPLVIILLLLSRKVLKRGDLRPAGVMLALSVLAGLRAVVATKFVGDSGAGFSAGIGPFHYLADQGLAILRYFRLAIVPWGFTVDPDLSHALPWLRVLAWAAVIGLLILARYRFTAVREGFWFMAGMILLIPSSTIFPAADLAADRRMYLPMIAFAAIIGLLAQNWHIWIPGAVVMVLIALSFLRMHVWQTEHALWKEAVQRSPGKLRPIVQLSRTAPADEALDLLLQAKTIAPKDAGIASELGVLWLKLGKGQNALMEFGRALALEPHSPSALVNRGAGLLALGQDKAALHDFEAALAIDPCNQSARINVESLGRPLPACPTAK